LLISFFFNYFIWIRRGVWIPTTPWESQWYAIVQWAGITDQAAIDYVLPNSQNFGCNLYAEVDLFEGGTASLSGCGGCVIQLRQSFYVSEARVLIPDEQTAFCGVVVANVAPVEIRCFIQDQILSPLEVPVGNAKYEIVVDYEINFDPTVINCAEVVTKNIDTDTFRAEAASILILMDEVIIQQAVVELAPSMCECDMKFYRRIIMFPFAHFCISLCVFFSTLYLHETKRSRHAIGTTFTINPSFYGYLHCTVLWP
jgi:hypothetical protein